MRVPKINIVTALSLFLLGFSGMASVATAQNATPKRVVVLYWYDKDYPGHARWDENFRPALQNSPTTIEYYPEYLEANRFPGEQQSEALRDYLRKKYSDRKIDVVVAQSEASFTFLLKNRNDLFPHVPLVFYVAGRPKPETLASEPDVTGLIVFNNFRRTIDLALSLHPRTEQLFVVSGTLAHDKQFEALARDDLRDYEKRVQINYLTDLPSNELNAVTRRLPERSIVLYVWQQSINENGKLMESPDVLDSFAPTSSVPVYAMSGPNIGRGPIGGYVYTRESSAAKVAELVKRIANGEKAQDIPVEGVPIVPMFDWRELQRWQIREDSLPRGSVIRFKELTFWQQYKWHIAGLFSLIALQSLFIAGLLIERKRRRRAKEALAQLNAELEERVADRTAALNAKSRELEAFAYSVAHDLKAPLRGIDGYSRLLLEDHAAELDEEGRSFVDTIQSSTQEMSELIDDLLAYSRLERRDFKLHRLELQPLISKIVDQKKRESNGRRIDFVIDVNGGSVLADANGLSQALSNYLDNAVKFTRNVPHPRVEIGAKESAENCVLWVRDNGIGFDTKYKDRLFNIFQRLHAAEDYPGTGVGLAIVRKAMERMGGRAWADSEPGKGATFYLEFPK
jgi:signal transduction histidine kinase